MRKNILLGVAVGAVLILGSAGGAFAGERGGNGELTQGPPHANSPCSWSGLEDGEEGGEGGPGITQNWGQIPQELRKDVSLRGRGAADVVIPGEGAWGCTANRHGQK